MKLDTPKALQRPCPECGAKPGEHCRDFEIVCVHVTFSPHADEPAAGIYVFHKQRVHELDTIEREIEMAVGWVRDVN